MMALLSDFDMVDEIDQAGNGVELLQLLGELEVLPEIVLLDINMPEMDGVEATKRIRELYPKVRILILSMEDDSQLVSLLVNEGVNGYLLKDADPDELELALKLVLKNDFYFSSKLSGAVLGSLRSSKSTRTNSHSLEFTERELEVLQLTCDEMTAAEIGDKLALSARTVEGYKRKLLEKTGKKNMAGLVIFAIQNSLVEI